MRRYRILALSTFGIDKPLGGGQVVVSGIYKYLSGFFDVTVLSIVANEQKRRSAEIKAGLHNVIIPMSMKEIKVLWDLESKYGIGLSDYIHIDNIALSSEFVEEFEKFSDWADIIVFEHPYLISLLDIKKIDKKIIYHAIDVEFLQKNNLYKNHSELLDTVKTAEAKACNFASAVFTTSKREETALRGLYPEYIGEKKLFIVPNGIDAYAVPFIARSEHAENKKTVSNKTTCLFVGSWHPPNLEALEFIIKELAPANADIQYFIVGSVKDFFYARYGAKAEVPDNVSLMGVLGENEKWEIYKLSDYAINPMFSGAGTNVKVLEYMAAGLPVITTLFGARGMESGSFAYFNNAREFQDAVNKFKESPGLEMEMIRANLGAIRTNYDFQVIARDIMFFIYADLLEDCNSLIIDSLSQEISRLGVPEYKPIVDIISQELNKIL